MDPICEKEGCYMFPPGSVERRACERACHIEKCACGHTRADHYSKPGWPACSKCDKCRQFGPDPLLRPELSWTDQRVLWNKHWQCARQSCRADLRHRRSGRIVAARHRQSGLLYCRRCCKLINDYNAILGDDLVEWVWSCSERGCNNLVVEPNGWCREHRFEGELEE